jgi:hypothetical protein
VKPDERSFRIALVADRYVNPPPGEADGVAAAAEAGWGVMQLPPADYPADITTRLLAQVAEQAEEFSRHGYDLVLIGEPGGLGEALAAVGVAAPDQIIPAQTADIVDFLTCRPAPAVSSWSWLAAGTADQPRDQS